MSTVKKLWENGSQNATPWIFGSIVAIFLLLQMFTIIEPGYRGVSVTLGQVDPHFRGEGPAFKMPFVERIIKIPVKQITIEGTAPSFSSDLQTVNISFKALYRIPEEHVVTLYQKYQGDPYETLVEPRIQDALKQVTALYRAENLVKQREKVRTQTLAMVRNALMVNTRIGTDNTRTPLVALVDLPISNIDLSEDLEKAIEMKQIKEQEALAKNYELDKARKQAEIVGVEARAEAAAVHIKGEALKASPEVIDLEIAKKWNGVPPTTVVVGKGGGNVLLPLK